MPTTYGCVGVGVGEGVGFGLAVGVGRGLGFDWGFASTADGAARTRTARHRTTRLARTRCIGTCFRRSRWPSNCVCSIREESDADDAEAISPAAVVHSCGVGSSSCPVRGQRRPLRPAQAECEDLRDDADPHYGSAHGRRAGRDPRLLRGRAEPFHARHERLGRARARVVAQPAGAPGCHG